MKRDPEIPKPTDYDPIEAAESQLVTEPGLFSPKNNKLELTDRRFHDWYRFVLSFPAHLVRRYLDEFKGASCNGMALDPFCGTGTTLVEAKLQGYNSIGVEANPFAQFASSTKLRWDIPVDQFVDTADKIANKTLQRFHEDGIDDGEIFDLEVLNGRLKALSTDQMKLILTNSISPLPLHKTLTLLEAINEHRAAVFYDHLLLALAKTLIFRASNLKFGPEVGLGKIRPDAPVVNPWLTEIRNMTTDIRSIKDIDSGHSTAFLGDSRQISQFLEPHVVDAVITSPPYPNEKDYTRTTRLESVVLGFIKSKEELRRFKKDLIRSNTRGVYKEDDDHLWISHHAQIATIAEQIERRRVELNKTSGFERLYARVTQLYFGGMAKHLKDMQTVLKPGAHLAYVVGDQASYLRVMIRTGQILAEVAQHLGYRVERIDLFRTRFATATGEQLREEVVVLTWPGE